MIREMNHVLLPSTEKSLPTASLVATLLITALTVVLTTTLALPCPVAAIYGLRPSSCFLTAYFFDLPSTAVFTRDVPKGQPWQEFNKSYLCGKPHADKRKNATSFASTPSQDSAERESLDSSLATALSRPSRCGLHVFNAVGELLASQDKSPAEIAFELDALRRKLRAVGPARVAEHQRVPTPGVRILHRVRDALVGILAREQERPDAAAPQELQDALGTRIPSPEPRQAVLVRPHVPRLGGVRERRVERRVPSTLHHDPTAFDLGPVVELQLAQIVAQQA
jgi:hypothetical protein